MRGKQAAFWNVAQLAHAQGAPSPVNLAHSRTPAAFNLQAALQEAEDRAKGGEVAMWRKRLHVYLDALFQRDPAAGADFADVQARDLRNLYWFSFPRLIPIHA